MILNFQRFEPGILQGTILAIELCLAALAIAMFVGIIITDGVVKSPISFVVGFSQNLNIPHVWLRAWEKHYASYIELFEVCAYLTLLFSVQI